MSSPTIQCKRLKALLRKHKLADKYGKLKVRTERIYRKGGFYEFGNAVAHVRELTRQEAEALVAADEYVTVKIFRLGRAGFSIVRSGGSDPRISEFV
jgi:hypothetical protein